MTGLHLVLDNYRTLATTQWRQQGQRMIPLNEAAEVICDLAGLTALPTYKMEYVRKLGFRVEVRV